MPESESAPRRLRDPHPCLKRGPGWLIFAIGLLGTFSASYPHGCLNVLLPSIARELAVDTSLIVIVNIAYSLISGVLTLPFGRWGDRIGYQKLFLMGQAILLVTNLLSTFLTVDFVTLILFRCLLAVGAAMVLSVVQAMLSQAFPGVRGRMMGLYSMSVSYSGAFAPLLSAGVADSFGDWRASLAIGVVFNAISLALGLIFLGKFQNKPSKADRKGQILLILTLGSLLTALNARTITIPVPVMIGLIALFVVSLLLFIRAENTAESPLLDFRLLKDKRFTLGFLGCLIGYIVSSACNTALPFFIQNIKGETATVSSLCTIWFSLVMGTFGPFTGGWCDKHGPYKFMLVSMIIQTFAIAGYASLGENSPLWHVVASVALYGLGGGLYYAPVTSMVMGTVPSNSGGVASGMLSTSRNVGAGIGATAFSLCVGLMKNTSLPFDNYVAGQRLVCWIMVALTALDAVLMLVLYLTYGRKKKETA